jgi:hypothetical protein
VRRVEARQVRVRFRVAEIVDRDDLDFPVALRLIERPQGVAPDASVTVDTDLDRHACRPLSTLE